MPDNLSILPVLVAGGTSKRMGFDKAEFEIRGKPLWERQFETLHALGLGKVAISIRNHRDWELPDDAFWMYDEGDDMGPLAALSAALVHYDYTHVLLLAVDMPSMDSDYLAGLIKDVKKGVGIVPLMGKYYDPLAAIYPLSVKPIVDGAIQEGKYAFQSITQSMVDEGLMKVTQVQPDQEIYFSNLNEPEDIEGIAFKLGISSVRGIPQQGR